MQKPDPALLKVCYVFPMGIASAFVPGAPKTFHREGGGEARALPHTLPGAVMPPVGPGEPGFTLATVLL